MGALQFIVRNIDAINKPFFTVNSRIKLSQINNMMIVDVIMIKIAIFPFVVMIRAISQGILIETAPLGKRFCGIYF